MFRRHSSRRPKPISVTPPNDTLERLSSPRRPRFKITTDEPNDILEFGKDSTPIMIGSSRKDTTESPRSPGPAAYDTFELSRSSPCFSLRSRPEVDYSTVTSNIEFPNIRQYPRKLEKHIGLRNSTQFWQKSDTPAPQLTSTAFDKPKIVIKQKPVEHIEETPGPGQYSPRSKSPMYLATFSKQKHRDTFNTRRSLSPGPAKYNINRSLISNEKWKGAIRPIKVWDYGEND